MRRKIVASVAALAVAAVTAGSAYAHSCSVVKKPVGAGSAATATVDVTTGTFTFTGGDFTKSGNLKGNFITVSVMAGSTLLDTVDVFKMDLPDGAHNSGPGGSSCDGVGIDDLAECGP